MFWSKSGTQSRQLKDAIAKINIAIAKQEAYPAALFKRLV
jgi:hypothetical protein